MSACLFTYTLEHIQNLSDTELDTCMSIWETHFKNYDKDNKFEVDRACGSSVSLEIANAEKYARQHNLKTIDIAAWLKREGMSGQPQLIKAWVDMKCKGKGTIEFIDYRVVYTPFTEVK